MRFTPPGPCLGAAPGSEEEVPAYIITSVGTVMMAADALQQMFQRFFLVPGSGFAQASTMTRVVVTYLETQTLALMSTATLRNGPYGSVGEWAGKDLLPKSYWG